MNDSVSIIKEKYQDLCFDRIIPKMNQLQELHLAGIQDNINAFLKKSNKEFLRIDPAMQQLLETIFAKVVVVRDLVFSIDSDIRDFNATLQEDF